MKFRNLGEAAIQAPALCLGTMTFGAEADEVSSRAIYSRCRDAGINLFDCANVYADGESERILGRLIHDHRDSVVIATKAYYPMHNDESTRGLSRSKLTTALHASLERLNTDYVDLYYLHHFDEEVPLDESMATLNDFVQQGKVRHVGVSNFAAWQVMKAMSISTQNHYASIVCIQPMYNLLKRQCESELLPMAASEKLGVLPYGPVAGGYLTGKYLESTSATGRFATDADYQARYAHDANQQGARRFVELARDVGVHPASLAIAWVASHPTVTAPIIGARNIEQLAISLASLDIDMTNELRQRISDISPQPALATDRAEEQK
jgi:aryl-alcohol dehydrogenase-like predicted oxidoreductase